MGIYDRDYYREQRPGFSLHAPRSVVGMLILINFAVWLVDGLFIEPQQGSRWLSNHMAVHVNTLTLAPAADRRHPELAEVVRVDTLTQPWLWWQYITYAFAHASEFNHILTNMLVLFFLGRDVEAAYGRREFLRLYLMTAVFAAVVWSVAAKLSGAQNASVYGASGAIAGVVVLFALNFPRQTLLLFFVIPVPAWFVGVLAVTYDVFGAMGRVGASNVAYTAHVAGAAFAFVYFRQRWSIMRWTDGIAGWLQSWSRPKLRIHQPPREEHKNLAEEVDRILEKIHREGEASLTTKERRILETASREYQRRGK